MNLRRDTHVEAGTADSMESWLSIYPSYHALLLSNHWSWVVEQWSITACAILERTSRRVVILRQLPGLVAVIAVRIVVLRFAWHFDVFPNGAQQAFRRELVKR